MLKYPCPKKLAYIIVALAYSKMAAAGQLDPTQIKLIQDTAASICDTIKEAKGKQTDTQLQGAVSAQLGGLIAKLADTKASGKGSFSQSEFEGAFAGCDCDSFSYRSRVSRAYL